MAEPVLKDILMAQYQLPLKFTNQVFNIKSTNTVLALTACPLSTATTKSAFKKKAL